MPTHQVDLTSLPEDQDAVRGYESILATWQKLRDGLDDSKSLSGVDLEETVSSSRPVMTPRELAFLNELLTATSSLAVEIRHAKVTGGFYKILMDRHGFKVSKDGGGLG
ncbi:hypothetical protein [Hyphomonas sp.]|uniref:hypothetical protein n=1 Tax=Hyphomonas sp. TaxID=87 RepID=UPI0025C3B527|nr:hypothetical protein [Hyphomonas sp.]